MLSIIYLLLCVRQCICIRLHSSSCVMMILTERSFATAVVSVENPLTLVGSDEQSDARLRHYGWCLFLLSSLSGSLKLAGRRRTSSGRRRVGETSIARERILARTKEGFLSQFRMLSCR